jgi:hypothetical protein
VPEVQVREAGSEQGAAALQLVDCDVHAQPPPSMLTPYMSERWTRHLERYRRYAVERSTSASRRVRKARSGGVGASSSARR